jgi:hypothetical protein
LERAGCALSCALKPLRSLLSSPTPTHLSTTTHGTTASRAGCQSAEVAAAGAVEGGVGAAPAPARSPGASSGAPVATSGGAGEREPRGEVTMVGMRGRGLSVRAPRCVRRGDEFFSRRVCRA